MASRGRDARAGRFGPAAVSAPQRPWKFTSTSFWKLADAVMSFRSCHSGRTAEGFISVVSSRCISRRAAWEYGRSNRNRIAIGDEDVFVSANAGRRHTIKATAQDWAHISVDPLGHGATWLGHIMTERIGCGGVGVQQMLARRLSAHSAFAVHCAA